jgi:polyhydroxyalkanoate synthesis regulator phasin
MRKLFVVGIMILALLAAGCSKAPAEAALKVADEAVAKVKPEAEKFVPEQFNALTAAVADARAKFDAKDYKGALTAAQEIPAKADETMKAATAKKEELTKQWADLQGSLPTMVQGLTEKIGGLAAMKKLPKGFDATMLESAKTSLADVTSGWTAATEAYTGGDIVDAIAKAGDVKTKAETLSKMLEVVPAPAAAK